MEYNGKLRIVHNVVHGWLDILDLHFILGSIFDFNFLNSYSIFGFLKNLVQIV